MNVKGSAAGAREPVPVDRRSETVKPGYVIGREPFLQAVSLHLFRSLLTQAVGQLEDRMEISSHRSQVHSVVRTTVLAFPVQTARGSGQG